MSWRIRGLLRAPLSYSEAFMNRREALKTALVGTAALAVMPVQTLMKAVDKSKANHVVSLLEKPAKFVLHSYKGARNSAYMISFVGEGNDQPGMKDFYDRMAEAAQHESGIVYQMKEFDNPTDLFLHLNDEGEVFLKFLEEGDITPDFPSPGDVVEVSNAQKS